MWYSAEGHVVREMIMGLDKKRLLNQRLFNQPRLVHDLRILSRDEFQTRYSVLDEDYIELIGKLNRGEELFVEPVKETFGPTGGGL